MKYCEFLAGVVQIELEQAFSTQAEDSKWGHLVWSRINFVILTDN